MDKAKRIKKLKAEIAKLQKELEEDEKAYENSFEWALEFPQLADDKGRFQGFDIIIGNPPYGLYNKKQNQKIGLSTDKRVLELIKQAYPNSLGGVVNAARFFYNLGFQLLNPTGFNSMIVPFGILTDTTSKKTAKIYF